MPAGLPVAAEAAPTGACRARDLVGNTDTDAQRKTPCHAQRPSTNANGRPKAAVAAATGVAGGLLGLGGSRSGLARDLGLRSGGQIFLDAGGLAFQATQVVQLPARTLPRRFTSTESMMALWVWNTRSTPKPWEILRTVNEEFRPAFLVPITTPS